jgi:nucleoside-diphosphate-sugar epimerase
MQRVLVTGALTPLGRRVTARLGERGDVEAVVTADFRQGAFERVSAVTRVAAPTRQSLAELIDSTPIDTVIHAGMCPDRSGTPSGGAADVIATQQLTAAISGRDTPVRVVVAVSSTEVYTPRSSSPLWRREDEALGPDPDSHPGLVLEAEEYLRDLAEHQPHVTVAILRLADLTGPVSSGPLASLWRRPFVPYVPGYDPAIQTLHIDDATRAIEHAAAHELAGTMNVAAYGVVTWRAAARLASRLAVPAPIVPDAYVPTMAGFGLPSVPASVADVLRFGRCVDTAAIAATGFEPERSTDCCVRSTARQP